MDTKKVKTVVVSSLIIASVGILFWQRSRIRELTAENDQLRHRSADVSELAQGVNSVDNVEVNRAELERLRNAAQELARLKAETRSPSQLAAGDLAATVDTLKKRFEAMPAKKIPELELLSAADWLEQAQHADVGSDIGVRKSLSDLRSKAKNKFAKLLRDALNDFADANSGQLPTNLTQVASHFRSPAPDEALARYGLAMNGPLTTDWVMNHFVKEIGIVDDDYDTLFEIGLESVIVHNIGPDARTVSEAVLAYASANNGQRPVKVDDLRPYLKGPVREGQLTAMFGLR